MKAQINIIEMILTAVVLLVAFAIFFPGFSYKSRWNEASLLVLGRDTTLTMDKIGQLYNFSFNSANMQQFLNSIQSLRRENIISFSQTEGTVKSAINIACNCTNEQLVALNNWLLGTKINGRSVSSLLCPTNLEAINPCIQSSDVLIIWGRKDLSKQIYRDTLRDYLKRESGIFEIADFKDEDEIDDTQRQIFGLEWCDEVLEDSCGFGPENTDSFFNPTSANEIIYQPFKLFFHLPFPLLANISEASILIEQQGNQNLLTACSGIINKGSFTFAKKSHDFWICNSNSVYFDTNDRPGADKIVRAKESFSIEGTNFILSFIDPDRIGIIFKINSDQTASYSFPDFLKKGEGPRLYPIDLNAKKILLHKGFYPGRNSDKPVPVVILNGTTFSRVAWMADPGLQNFGDDHKQLFNALMFWVSNKRPSSLLSPNLRVGFLTSYVNVFNDDMYEVYLFDLGLGFPF